MAKQAKTQAGPGDPVEFLNSVEDPQRRADALELSRWITEITGEAPRMWGSAILGWGTRQVQYASGRTEPWMCVGFSPRKAELAVYGLMGLGGVDADLSQLGKVKTGKGCVWIKRLSDVNRPALETALREVWAASSIR